MSSSKRPRCSWSEAVEGADDDEADGEEASPPPPPPWRRFGSDAPGLPSDWAATALADALAETSLLPPALACEGGGDEGDDEEEASETEGDAARARTTFFLLLGLDLRRVAGPLARRQSGDASESEGSGAAAAPPRGQVADASIPGALRPKCEGRSAQRGA